MVWTGLGSPALKQFLPCPCAGEAASSAAQSETVTGAEAEAVATRAPPKRQPSIKFPPRRTPDGVAISSLPVEEQQKCASARESLAPASESPERLTCF
jgi:hypothetical protein